MPFNVESSYLSLLSIPGDKGWRVVEPLVYEDFALYDNISLMVRVEVKPGFETDLASIPGIARWLVSNDDWRIRRPAIVHDWLYQEAGACELRRTKGFLDKFVPSRLSRRECDKLFYYALRSNGLSNRKALLMYFAVRIGGWFYWGE